MPVWAIRVGQKWPNPLISYRIVKKKFKVEKNQDAATWACYLETERMSGTWLPLGEKTGMQGPGRQRHGACYGMFSTW